MADSLIEYAFPLDDTGWAKQWRVMLIPGDGHRSRLHLRLPPTGTNNRLLAAVDVNRDGRAEALLDYQDGASTNFFEIVAVADGRLSRVSSPAGTPFSFGMGGGVLHGEGGGCRLTREGPELFATGYFERDGAWHWYRNEFRWTGTGLSRAGHQTGRLDGHDIGDYSQFRCFGIHWPGTVPSIPAR